MLSYPVREIPGNIATGGTPVKRRTCDPMPQKPRISKEFCGALAMPEGSPISFESQLEERI